MISWLLLLAGLIVIATGQVVEARANPGRPYTWFRRARSRPVVPRAVPWIFTAGMVTVWVASARLAPDGFSWAVSAAAFVGTCAAYLGPLVVHNRRVRVGRELTGAG